MKQSSNPSVLEALLSSLSLGKKLEHKELDIYKDIVKPRIKGPWQHGSASLGLGRTLKAQRAHARRIARIVRKKEMSGVRMRKRIFMKNLQWGIPVYCQQLMQVCVSSRLRLRFGYDLFLLLFVCRSG